MLRTLMLSTLALGLAAVALPAAAQSSRLSDITVQGTPRSAFEVQHQVVRISDLDVNTPDGAYRLLMRVSRAADEVCSPGAAHPAQNLLEYDDYNDYRRCKIDGIRVALADVDTPAVTQLLSTVR
jgi:UrcA family protein